MIKFHTGEHHNFTIIPLSLFTFLGYEQSTSKAIQQTVILLIILFPYANFKCNSENNLKLKLASFEVLTTSNPITLSL